MGQDHVMVNNEQMADALFEHFSGLLGSPALRSRTARLDLLDLPSLDLSSLDVCFSEEEIWAVIRDIPAEKAPGPDGFNGLFYKKAWPIIKGDIVAAFNAFWALDGRSFHLVNEALLILLRKKSNAEAINDYRPISLMHSIGKLITKCLASRLSTCLSSLDKSNQTAFIRGRCIQDNFRTVQLSCKLLNKLGAPAVLMKIDIAKAFDSVSWPFLLEVLQHAGFSRRWRDWMALILSTASTRILLNGRPGARICHARGLRQGDPLSPMLFVLTMEVLNALILKADQELLFSPLGCASITYKASFYADDMVIFIKPMHQDLQLFLAIMTTFEQISGLKTNKEKSKATPINCSVEDLQTVSDTFGCAVEAFPCRYLGVPLSITRLRRSDEQPIIDAVSSRIPTWKGTYSTWLGVPLS
jgi:hypothetical protein